MLFEKRGLYAYAKSIDPDQPAQSAQADLGRNFLLLNPFFHIYSFNTLRKTFKNIGGKGEVAQNEQFHPFPLCFSMQFVSFNPLIASFQLSSTASLNSGWSQNDVLGKGLKILHVKRPVYLLEKERFFMDS